MSRRRRSQIPLVVEEVGKAVVEKAVVLVVVEVAVLKIGALASDAVIFTSHFTILGVSNTPNRRCRHLVS